MAEGQERIELKFRIYDGTDMAHTTYASSTTIATLKQRLVAEWPQGKTITPKSVNDIKLIHAGKILENSKTLADSKVTFGDLPSSVITMHVVVQPHVAKKKTDASTTGDDAKFALLVATRYSPAAIATTRPCSLSNPKEHHELVRRDVKQVVCSLCNTEQQVAQICSNCGVKMGEYFCNICKFYDDETSKGQFHCDDCGICRVGGRSEFFHCQKCGSCYSVSVQDNHVCVENSMKNYCPVCYEYLFDSIKGSTVMNCGHTMHSDCFRAMADQNQYTSDQSSIVALYAPKQLSTCLTTGSCWRGRFRSSAMTVTIPAKPHFTS
ncbi:hypothetical protein JRO89_XS01G0378300 [Xanthoceras sorbifolium]|uniref:Uncharacterized protein n=1 Tax=Xanthoceras sorbifolium TaxID=99658 RepID=A0ABQ8IP70_9ROSI|nr:hypothetical protein JRO89_XS01G0378300 [Xanthoceras sorbifolium]